MKAKKTYYKVCAVGPGRILRSSVVDIFQNVCVYYKVGEWVASILKGSKLFVFDNLTDAKMYNEINGGRVYECEVKNPTAPNLRVFDVTAATIEKFWQSNKKGSWDVLVGGCPSGTAWVSAVKLIKPVVL